MRRLQQRLHGVRTIILQKAQGLTHGRFWTIFFVLLVTSSAVFADVIKFTEEELPRESVLPIFDNPEAVKQKYVPFENRSEIGVWGGFTTNDPINNTIAVGGEYKYHLTDFHAVGVVGSYHFISQTQYVQQLINQVPGASAIPFSLSSSPLYSLFGEYEFTPYYGKISITKQGVMNLAVSFSAGAGMLAQSSSAGTQSGFGFSFGLNQRLFFTRNLGLKIDLKALFYNQTDIIPVTPQTKLFTNVLIGLGAVYLLPSL